VRHARPPIRGSLTFWLTKLEGALGQYLRLRSCSSPGHFGWVAAIFRNALGHRPIVRFFATLSFFSLQSAPIASVSFLEFSPNTADDQAKLWVSTDWQSLNPVPCSSKIKRGQFRQKIVDDFALCPSFIGAHRLCINIQRDFAGRVPKQFLHDLDLFPISVEQRGKRVAQHVPSECFSDAHRTRRGLDVILHDFCQPHGLFAPFSAGAQQGVADGDLIFQKCLGHRRDEVCESNATVLCFVLTYVVLNGINRGVRVPQKRQMQHNRRTTLSRQYR
jgi:hypothetical protein